MSAKFGFMLAIGFGLALAVLSVPTSAYTMSILFQIVRIDTFLAWSLSSAVPAFLLMFPAGFFVFKYRPFIFGTLVGFIAVLALCSFAALNGVDLSRGFALEYVSLIIFSGVASYFGHLAKTLLGESKQGARLE